jgi:hypothetical protein
VCVWRRGTGTPPPPWNVIVIAPLRHPPLPVSHTAGSADTELLLLTEPVPTAPGKIEDVGSASSFGTFWLILKSYIGVPPSSTLPLRSVLLVPSSPRALVLEVVCTQTDLCFARTCVRFVRCKCAPPPPLRSHHNGTRSPRTLGTHAPKCAAPPSRAHTCTHTHTHTQAQAPACWACRTRS